MFQVRWRRRICSGFGVWTHLWPGDPLSSCSSAELNSVSPGAWCESGALSVAKDREQARLDGFWKTLAANRFRARSASSRKSAYARLISWRLKSWGLHSSSISRMSRPDDSRPPTAPRREPTGIRWPWETSPTESSHTFPAGGPVVAPIPLRPHLDVVAGVPG